MSIQQSDNHCISSIGEKQDFCLYWGVDFEFISAIASQLPTPVTQQIFIPKLLKPDLLLIEYLTKRCGLLAARERYGGLGLVFDVRGVRPGKPMRVAFAEIINSMIRVLGIPPESKITFYAHWLNAEMSLFYPDVPELRATMHEQEDDPYSSRKNQYAVCNHNLQFVPIQGTHIVRNYRVGIINDITIDFLDTFLLSGKVGLDKLGKSIGVHKREADWDKWNADEFLKRDEESFIEYGIADAAITVLYARYYDYTFEKIVKSLVDKDCISYNQQVEKRTLRPSVTVASCTEFLMEQHLKHKGQYQKFKEQMEYLKQCLPRLLWDRRKGGLNKCFVAGTPMIFKGIDIWDIKSAYVQGLMELEFPLWNSRHGANWFNPDKPITAKQLAKQINRYYTAFLRVKVEMPENSTEHERSILFYAPDGEAVTCRVSDDNQWLTHWEIFTLAYTCPKAKVWVKDIVYWEYKKGGETICYRELFRSFSELKDKFEREGDEGMRTVIKLIGNGGIGKLAQNTDTWVNALLHDAIMADGELTRTALGEKRESKVTNPLHFNLITSLVRCVVAIKAYQSNALMTVTDSIVCPHGKFKLDAKTGCKRLDDIISRFRWELEHENVNAQINKERDYYVFTTDYDYIIDKMSRGEDLTEEEFNLIEILKIAKRGYKSPKGLSKEESYRDFVRGCIKRIRGEVIKNDSPRLTTFSQMLQGKGGGILNSEYRFKNESIGMGNENIKYNCEDLYEFNRRKRRKQRCRAKGYADYEHCKLLNPELAEQIDRTTKPKPRQWTSIPHRIKRLITYVHRKGLASYRDLERICKIGKSTVNRWVKDIESSLIPKGIDKYVEIDFNLDKNNPLDVLKDYFIPSASGGSDPQYVNGTATAA